MPIETSFMDGPSLEAPSARERSQGAVLREHLGGLGARHVGAPVEERLGLRDRGVAGIVAGDRAQVADRGRVDHADRPAAFGGDRAPARVQAPAHLQVRERQQRGRGRRRERGHGADLHEARAMGEHAGPASRHVPRRVRRERVRGLGEREAEALGEQQEAIEEAAREHDVVVDDQQPVGVRERCRGQRGVDVRPLARAGGGRGQVQRDIVSRAPQLALQARDRAPVLGPRDADDVHSPARSVPRRAPNPPVRGQPLQSRADVAHRARKRAPAPERPRAPRQVLRVERVRRRRRGVERLGEPPERQRAEHDAGAAAPAHGVPDAAGERAQLRPWRGRDAFTPVIAARVAAAAERRAREAGEPGIAAGPAVIDAGGGDVAHASAGRLEAPLPVFLVAVEVERLLEAAGPLQRAAAQRQVRAPGELGVGVVRSEVERGDRQRLAPAGAQPRALEPGPDRPAEDLVPGRRVHAGEHRVQPAGPDLHVVVEEADELALGRVQRRVARGVEPARGAVGEIARAEARGEGGGLGVVRVVLHHEDLAPAGGGLRRHGGERDREIGAPAPGGEADRGRDRHAAPRLCGVILQLHHRYRHPGGEERAVADLAWLIRTELGEDVEVLERQSDAAGRGRAALGLLAGGLRPGEVAEAVRRSGARVVHAHNVHPTLGWRALAAAREAGARVVLHLHNYRLVCAVGTCFTHGEDCTRCHGRDTRPGVRLNCRGSLPEAVTYAAGLSLWQRRLTDAADALVVPSEFALDRLRALGAPVDGARVLPSVQREIAGRSRADEGEYVLAAGRLTPEKGFADVVSAAKLAGLPLVVAGDGPELAALKELAGAPPARFVGRVSAERLAELRAHAAVAVVPSRYAEILPLAALEAMAAGLPVVAARSGGLADAVAPEGLYEPGDVDALAQRLRQLYGDAEAGARALQRARERYAPGVIAATLRAIYDRNSPPATVL